MGTERKPTDTESHVGADSLAEPQEEPQVRLQHYEETKFEVAGLIREASSAAWRAKNETLQKDFESLLQRLAEDRFYLTLAGQFSRGKSTLLNAMFGMDRLPTGVVPVTSVITAVSYNTWERVRMHFADSNLTYDVPLSELPDWITERGNPGNERHIDMAEVQLPAELLRRGAFFVDTPGLGSAVIENTKTTQRFLPHIDALVLVTSFELPLSQEEVVFLARIRELRRRIFLVVNKQDLCAAQQREEVLAFIHSRLAEEFGPEDIPVFSVSAAQALAARLEGDLERIESTGIPLFEKALVGYLLRERSRDFLAALCDRIESLLSSPEVPELKELHSRLEAIRAKLGGRSGSWKEAYAGRAVQAAVELDVKASPCFVCKRMADATFKFMSQFQYNLSHNREEQLFHASRSGFCTLHTREYARLASPQGIASGYPKTLLFVAEHLQSLSYQGRLRDDWKEKFDEILPSSQKCRACQAVAAIEFETIGAFVRENQDIQGNDRVVLPCVCLTHLKAIIDQTPSSELANRLVLRSATLLKRIAEDMERFALRHGGRHMELVTDDEFVSPEKGLNLLVGQPNVRPAGRT